MSFRLAALLGEYMHKKTLFPTRPFGAVVLLVGYESIKGANLIEIDPLGNCYESRFICRGKSFLLARMTFSVFATII